MKQAGAELGQVAVKVEVDIVVEVGVQLVARWVGGGGLTVSLVLCFGPNLWFRT